MTARGCGLTAITIALLVGCVAAPARAQNPPATPEAGAAAVPNYADERTDFGAPAQDTLQIDMAAPTPLTIPGALVVTTDQVRDLIGTDIVLIDVWKTGAHLSLPGAVALPGAGDPGNFKDALQQRLGMALSVATHQDMARRLIFFCTEARCWEAYNAALRAAHLGYTRVEWYRGGLASWHAAGQPLAPLGQKAGPTTSP